MATIEQRQPTSSRLPSLGFDWNRFVSENITRSWWLTLWLILLTYITIQLTLSRLQAAPISTILVLIVWAATVLITVGAEVARRHRPLTLWLRNNLYNSITNIQLTLIITLLLIAAAFGFYRYAFETASFTTVPATDIRAELVDTTADSYCFVIGKQVGGSVDGSNTCFPKESFAPELSDTDLTAVTLGQAANSFCFDTMPNDPENGISCFSSTADNPGLYAVKQTFSGANWGAVAANLTTLMVFRFSRDELWRVTASIVLVGILLLFSLIVYRDSFGNKRVRQLMTYAWLLSPIILYILLGGVPDVPGGEVAARALPLIGIIVVTAVLWYANRYVNNNYPPQVGEPEVRRMGRIVLSLLMGIGALLAFISAIRLVFLLVGLLRVNGEQLFVALNPDVDWGGFLLTLIITVFAIVVSFPLGVMLALGRRSEIRGIPAWITYPLALIAMVFLLVTRTPDAVAQARNTFELLFAYWPLALPVLAYIFQRVWNGNVVAAFSTMYIEFIRGIPLITVLFLSIILFPILLPPDVEILTTWRVLWAVTLFAAAYLAENVRGGLQAIPKGQYEAADSLGLSTFNKYRLIILPQALRIVIPAITNQYIGLFKDTTLVAIIGLLDILGVANAIAAQPQWLGVRREAYIFIAVLYFVISAVIAGYSARLERRAGLGER